MTTDTIVPSGFAPSLRRLYFVRFAFALIWAALVAGTVSKLDPLSVTLLVLYPVFDVAAAVVDVRSAKNTKPFIGLYVNMAISLLAGVALALAASSGIPGILRVWGIWASVSGLIQLVVGLVRRTLGGQWPMIISGAISTVAGATFIVQAAQPNPSLAALAGYAALGGVFFLVSAIRLGAVAKTD
jgi:uncharacterized membrane protein HdeD (DUF308 family)